MSFPRLAALSLLGAVGAPLHARPVQITPVPVPHPEAQAGHILRRTSFGAKPDEVTALASGGANGLQAYLDAQLDPFNQIPVNPAVTALLAQIPYQEIQDLQEDSVVRQSYSDRQLNEVMTLFWETWFNTSALSIKGRVKSWQTMGGPDYTELHVMQLEQRQNNGYDDGVTVKPGYRQQALTTFKNLLEVNAGNTAMRIYLNLVGSICQPGFVPNEDFAREFLELHTVGPEDPSGAANYIHEDIEMVAEIFAGWTADSSVNGPVPYPFPEIFDSSRHCQHTSSWTLFSSVPHMQDVTITANPADHEVEGMNLIAAMAAHPMTAERVCRALIRFFLADDADHPTLLANCVADWGPEGDINQVVRRILESGSFQGSAHRWDRAGLPGQYLIGLVRTYTDSWPDLSLTQNVRANMARMGERRFEYPAPDGYPGSSFEQLGSQLYLDRVDFAKKLITTNFFNPHRDVQLELPQADWNSKNEIARFFLDRQFQGNWTDDDRLRAIAVIDNSAPLDWSMNFADWKLRVNRCAMYVHTLPQSLQR